MATDTASLGDDVLNALNREHIDIGLGLTALRDFAEGNFDLAAGTYTIVVPSELVALVDRAVSEQSEEHRQFLLRILTRFGPGEPADSDRLLSNLDETLRALVERERLISITEEDPEIAAALEGSFEFEDFEIALSPGDNFAKRYYAKLLSWSKKSTGVIVERTKETFSHLGEYVLSLQIPNKVAKGLAAKRKFADKLFAKIGGPNTKLFIGVVVSAAGFFSGALAISIAGAVLTIADP